MNHNSLENYNHTQIGATKIGATKIGATGHVEYSWSNDIREKIFQFQLQLTRTDEEGVRYLEKCAMEIMTELTIYYYKSHYQLSTITSYDKEYSSYYLTLFYKIIGHTRDIEDGKGEYALSYMLIYVWYNFYPELALFALKCFVNTDDETRPYGSWKDIKYFCHYLYIKKRLPIDHTLIRYAIMLMNSQLQKDHAQVLSSRETKNLTLSLVAKWIPREKSNKFGWLYKELACQYFFYMKTAKDSTRHKAVLKSMIEYRKIMTKLNVILDTLQIKQCNKGWAEIDFSRVTSISLVKQSSALSNMTLCGNEKTELEERKICKEHFETYIQKRLESKVNTKRERVNVVDLVKQAMYVNSLSLKENAKNVKNVQDIQNVQDPQNTQETQKNIQIKKDVLNMLWKEESDSPFCKMIPIIDISSYNKEEDSYYAAIGIGLKIVEKSVIGKRMMVFGGFPNWISFEDSSNFTDMVQKVQDIESGLNPDLYSTLEKMVDTIVEAELTEETVKTMTIVILSNWNVERWDKENNNTVYENIQQIFEKTKCMPRILMWNLKSNDGFPCLSLFSNIGMTSGYNPKLLNTFYHNELKSLKQYIPWNFFLKSLENKRYDILEKRIQNFFISSN